MFYQDKRSQIIEQPQVSQLQRVQQRVQLHKANQLASTISSDKYHRVTTGEALRQERFGTLGIGHLR